MQTRHTNRVNAFALGNAGAIDEILSSLLGEPTPGDANGVFRERAAAPVGALTPVLVWMRDHKGVLLNIDTVRLSFELRSTWKVATKRVFEVRNPITDEMADIPVPEILEDLIYPLQAYLGERASTGTGRRARSRRSSTGSPSSTSRTPSRRSALARISNEDMGHEDMSDGIKHGPSPMTGVTERR